MNVKFLNFTLNLLFSFMDYCLKNVSQRDLFFIMTMHIFFDNYISYHFVPEVPGLEVFIEDPGQIFHGEFVSAHAHCFMHELILSLEDLQHDLPDVFHTHPINGTFPCWDL